MSQICVRSLIDSSGATTNALGSPYPINDTKAHQLKEKQNLLCDISVLFSRIL